MPFGYVYMVTNTINDKKYIGLHKSEIFDVSYWGSGKLIKLAIKKYGKQNFTREILLWCNTVEELVAAELFEIRSRDAANSDDYYNIICSPTPLLIGEQNGFYGKNHSEETKALLSTLRKGQPITKQHRLGLNVWLKSQDAKILWNRYSKERTGSVLSTEHKAKIKETLNTPKHIDRARNQANARNADIQWRDSTYTAEFKKTVGDRFRGVPKSNEHRLKISESLKGQDHYWQDSINKNPVKISKTAETHRGSVRSIESRKRMSDAKKGKPAHNKGSRWVHDPATTEKKMIGHFDTNPDGFENGYGPRKHKI